MAWSAPMTAIAGAVYLAAEFNQYVRDNLLETAPAKATAANRIFVTTGANAITERAIGTAQVTSAQSTSSTAFTDLATVGPAVTITTGTLALAWWSAQMDSNTATDANLMGIAVSGATTIAATSDTALILRAVDAPNFTQQAAMAAYFSLTPGSNTFTAKYATGGGTGRFDERKLLVIPL